MFHQCLRSVVSGNRCAGQARTRRKFDDVRTSELKFVMARCPEIQPNEVPAELAVPMASVTELATAVCVERTDRWPGRGQEHSAGRLRAPLIDAAVIRTPRIAARALASSSVMFGSCWSRFNAARIGSRTVL